MQILDTGYLVSQWKLMILLKHAEDIDGEIHPDFDKKVQKHLTTNRDMNSDD